MQFPGLFELAAPYCYAADNNFAYAFDAQRNADTIKRLNQDLKDGNFTPTYDTWCLYCRAKDAKFRCGKCRSVYFCDEKCQSKSWAIHKKHCGRNLFGICITCGSSNITTKCDKCPVKWCSNNCRRKIEKAHIEYDCTYFGKTFN